MIIEKRFELFGLHLDQLISKKFPAYINSGVFLKILKDQPIDLTLRKLKYLYI